VKDIRRLLWLIVDHTVAAFIRVLDAVGQPRNERGE